MILNECFPVRDKKKTGPGERKPENVGIFRPRKIFRKNSSLSAYLKRFPNSNKKTSTLG
jgi:hypothetical protein